MLTFLYMFYADVIATWPIVGATAQDFPSEGSGIAHAVERGRAARNKRREREMRCHKDAPANQAEVRQSLRHLSYIQHIFDGKYEDTLRVRNRPAFSAPTQRATPADFPRVARNKNDGRNHLNLTRADGARLSRNHNIGTLARQIETRDAARPMYRGSDHWVPREHEAGRRTADLCRKHGISDAAFYNWKSKYGRVTVSETARLRTLKDESRRLKKLLAESMLDVSALKDQLGKN